MHPVLVESALAMKMKTDLSMQTKRDRKPAYQNPIQNVHGSKVVKRVPLLRAHLPRARIKERVECLWQKIVTRYLPLPAHFACLLLPCHDSVPRIDAMYTPFTSPPSPAMNLRNLLGPGTGTNRNNTMAAIYPPLTETMIPTTGQDQKTRTAARNRSPKTMVNMMKPRNAAARQLKCIEELRLPLRPDQQAPNQGTPGKFCATIAPFGRVMSSRTTRGWPPI